MFERELTNQIQLWKKGVRKPLIVRGLRQVGKTTTILDFCKNNYDFTAYIDFRSDPSFSEIFEGNFDIDRITGLISTKVANIRFVPGKTVIFLDEIQECSKARAALKYFYLDKRYDVIASGSLLGVKNYNQDTSRSVSVGFETYLTMYPMSFKEFVLALGKGNLIPYVEEALATLREIDPFVHRQLIDLYRCYLAVGGMPEVVKAFIETNNFDQVMQTQSDLLTTYTDDFGRNINAQNVATRDGRLFGRIVSVYKSIPQQLAKENNKFQYSAIAKGGRASTYYDAIEWLIGSGLAIDVKNLKSIEVPFCVYRIEDQFKLYFADTGLLMPSYGKAAQNILLTGNSGPFKGAIYENAICAELIRKGLTPHYFQRANRLEVDFAIEGRQCPIAIEVKSTNSKSKSLSTLAANPENYGSKQLKCLKLYEKNVAVNRERGIINLPYYALGFIDFDNVEALWDK